MATTVEAATHPLGIRQANGIKILFGGCLFSVGCDVINMSPSKPVNFGLLPVHMEHGLRWFVCVFLGEIREEHKDVEVIRGDPSSNSFSKMTDQPLLNLHMSITTFHSSYPQY